MTIANKGNLKSAINIQNCIGTYLTIRIKQVQRHWIFIVWGRGERTRKTCKVNLMEIHFLSRHLKLYHRFKTATL